MKLLGRPPPVRTHPTANHDGDGATPKPNSRIRFRVSEKIGFSASDFARQVGRHPKLVGGIASVAGVLLLCRGLIFGTGTYQLYVDPAVPPSPTLLHDICSNSLNLWASGNLGYRVLVPGNYLVCAGINGLLAVGVPAWAVSRLLPVLCLCMAASGMTLLLYQLRLRGNWPQLGPISALDILVASTIGILYACSPYSFNELAASHFTYLVAIGLFPWIAWILSTWKQGAVSVLSAALLLAVAYSQLQFVVMAPAALLVLALILGSKALAWRTLVASAGGLIPHLPWILPLVAYPPTINASDYLLPGTDTKFAVVPWEAARLVGYVTPFAESAVSGWEGVWRAFSYEALIIAAVGLGALSRRRGIGLVAIIAGIGFYEWGAKAPGFAIWSGLVPTSLAGLFRERYSLTFLTLVFLATLIYVGIVATSRKSGRLGIAAALVTAVGLAGPFADGHLGPFGKVRESFNTAERLAGYIRAHGGGPVLTVPPGSVVQGQGWAYVGRSPFSIGEPYVFDLDGSPNAPALPMVGALVRSLASPDPSTAGDAAEYVKLLRLRYVVDWQVLTSQAPIDRVALRRNLVRFGAKVDWQNRDVRLWELPQNDVQQLKVADAVYIASNIHDGVFDQSELWGTPLALSSSQAERDVVVVGKESGGLIHLATREIIASRTGIYITVQEPVFIVGPTGMLRATATYSGTADAGPVQVFPDGTAIPEGESKVKVSGPIDHVQVGVSSDPLHGQSLIGAIPNVQDTANASGLSLLAAGTRAYVERSGPTGVTAVALEAARDEAGLPVELAIRAGKYKFSFETRQVVGGPARAAIVVNGTRELASVPLSQATTWSRNELSVVLPKDAVSAYLYFYIQASGRPAASKMLIRNLQASVASPLPNKLRALRFQGAVLGSVEQAQSLTPPSTSLSLNPAEAAADLQDTAAHTTGTVAARAVATYDDPEGQPAVSITAIGDEAGLPVKLPPLQGSYSISLFTRHESGVASRISVVANGDRTVATVDLPLDPSWRKVSLRFASPPDARDLYLYVYVPGGSSKSPTREAVGRIRAVITPFFQDVVITHPGCASDLLGSAHRCLSASETHGMWVFLYQGADPWWRTTFSGSRRPLPLLANGFGNIWFASSSSKMPANLAAYYLPDGLFKAAAASSAILAAILSVFLCLHTVWFRRRAHDAIL